MWALLRNVSGRWVGGCVGAWVGERVRERVSWVGLGGSATAQGKPDPTLRMCGNDHEKSESERGPELASPFGLTGPPWSHLPASVLEDREADLAEVPLWRLARAIEPGEAGQLRLCAERDRVLAGAALRDRKACLQLATSMERTIINNNGWRTRNPERQAPGPV